MNQDITKKLLWYARHGVRRLGPVGLAGVGFAVVGLALYAALVAPSQARLGELKQATATLHERLQRAAGSFSDARRTPEEQLANFYNSFPGMQSAPDLLGKIYKSAERRGLTLQQGEYKPARERLGLLTRYQITLPVKGPYLQVREFLGAVLKDIPFIALDNVSFQRERIGEPAVEAKIQLTLYVGETS